MDFCQIKERACKNGVIEIYPDFKVCRSKDLMVRGKSFYAIWDEELGMWSTDEYDVQRLVDKELMLYREKVSRRVDSGSINVKLLSDFSSNSWVQFKKYVSNVSDNSHQLDESLTFSNTKIHKKDYVSKKLSYPLEKGDISAYDELIGTLYDESERAKLEWAIGSIIAGDSKTIQKFIVLYGEAGAGKSTVLNIIQKLFDGYYTTFEAKALTSSSNAFSTEVFKSNPLVAIQHDGDLSKIEDNTKLNSIVSHEEMTMNEKYKPSYTSKANCFLFMATNKPVKITDAKSGIIRRLIDVSPSGRKLPSKKYTALYNQIDFELGAIAEHCLNVYYKMGKNYYQNYRPVSMMFKTDVFFNFVESNYYLFKEQDGVSLSQAYDIYKAYCDDALVEFKLPKYRFREELKNYFLEFFDITRIDGKQIRSYYSGFLIDKFKENQNNEEHTYSLVLDQNKSIFDEEFKDCKAQYATTRNEVPYSKWDEVKTKLSDINTKRIHYVKPPENHIVIDFDLKDDNGEKSLEKNLEEASKWPPTYAEYSKGGKGIHLHYIYEGDVSLLSSIYSENIEIKVFTGGSSLRRKLTKCNSIPFYTLKDGTLPQKRSKKMINNFVVKNEKKLRDLILRALLKEIHANTKPNVDYIYKILEDAYNNGIHYDVTDLRPKILNFALKSTNQRDYCVKMVSQMHFKSEEISEPGADDPNAPIIFFDTEVFPNLFLLNWKYRGKDKKCVRMINPSPQEVEAFINSGRLIGFNCRRYDNHILYARHLGYTNEELYRISKGIIGKSKNCFFGEAYNISYTDVYDFCSTKQSLKKWEIELDLHHKELGLDWDKPVPEELWPEVAAYCDNDVISTEAVFEHEYNDFVAREILADISGLSVNDTTNQHTNRIIFGKDKNVQNEFNYFNLGEPVLELGDEDIEAINNATPLNISKRPEFIPYNGGQKSILPYFPGYKFDRGHSLYRGEDPGEGGYVYAEPGMYGNVALLDVASEHPSSIECMNLFGPRTKNFSLLKQIRIYIKHKEYDKVGEMFDGKLKKYLKDKSSAKALSYALKIAINSVYGLTSASFDSNFKDKRNIDNIVAKRGALFMIDLKNAVQEKGFVVAHIKTDSIKIPDATPEIIDFVIEFGKKYGYNFEHEATYEKMCLVNNAVYIAKYAWCEDPEMIGKWTATGAQFAQPYVFKTCFSKEDITFRDLCEPKTVTSSLYLDMNEGYPDVSDYEVELKKRQHNQKPGVKTIDKLNPLFKDLTDDQIIEEINKGHNYQFVGKAALVCPIKPGLGGGWLVRKNNDFSYSYATGTKDFRWLESENVQAFRSLDDIDYSYFNSLVDAARNDISQYGDYEWFVSDKPCFGTNDEHIYPFRADYN